MGGRALAVDLTRDVDGHRAFNGLDKIAPANAPPRLRDPGVDRAGRAQYSPVGKRTLFSLQRSEPIKETIVRSLQRQRDSHFCARLGLLVRN
jgi:hypothetical protein